MKYIHHLETRPQRVIWTVQFFTEQRFLWEIHLKLVSLNIPSQRRAQFLKRKASRTRIPYKKHKFRTCASSFTYPPCDQYFRKNSVIDAENVASDILNQVLSIQGIPPQAPEGASWL